MARISTYSSDTSITGVEKLLGTDAGTTKLFSLSDLQTYFTQTVTLSSTLGSDLLPSSDGTFDLGSSSAEWQDLFIDGTANIDSLIADTADINAGTIDGVTIGGSSAAAGTFTTMNATTVQVGGSAIKVAGKETIWVPASAMYGATTNGADAQQVETTATRPDMKVLDFDAGTDEFAQFSVAMPKSWNEGTLTYQVYWSPGSTNTGDCILDCKR